MHSAYRLEDVVRVTADVQVGSAQKDGAVMDIEEGLPCRIVGCRRAGAGGFGPVRSRDIVRGGDTLIVEMARAGLSARGPPLRKREPLGQLSLPFPKMRRG
jgi:voltage-gated potassium channel